MRKMSEKIVSKIGGKTIKGINYIDSHEYIPKARAILETVGNLRLVGETGTGKTTMVHKLSEIYDMPLFEIVLTRDITKWDLLASDVLREGSTQTREGIILKWLRAEKGILYLDGFNYAEPSILSLIESLTDFRGSVWIPELETVFKRSEKHFVVISYNPSEKSGYSGTFLENIATIRRFEGLVIDYIDRKDEIDMIRDASGGDYDFAVKFVEIARKTRDLYKRGKLRTPITTGNLLNYAVLFNKKSLSEADLVEIASSLYPEDERDLFTRLFEEKGEIDVEKAKKDAEKDED
jgi:MoxR-like ATPase